MAPSPFRTRVITTQGTRPQDEEVYEGRSGSDYWEGGGWGEDHWKGQEFLGSDAVRVYAAEKIQTSYRRHLKRKNVQAVVLKGADANQTDLWHILRQRSKEMGWSRDSQYYILFRVPLGSILACLGTIAGFLGPERGRAKEKMEIAEGKELEAATDASNKLK